MLLTLRTRLWTAYASFVFAFRCCVRHVMLFQVDIEYCRASTGSWVPVIIVGLLDSLLRGFLWVCAGCGRLESRDFWRCALLTAYGFCTPMLKRLTWSHTTSTTPHASRSRPLSLRVRDLRLHVTSWWRHGFFVTRRRLHLLPRGVQHVHRYAVGFWFWGFFLFTRWDVPIHNPI